jgi:hypothetical protein
MENEGGPSDDDGDVDYGKPLSVGGEWSPEKKSPDASKATGSKFEAAAVGSASKPEFEL